jgi:tetratricopeptide (TPR) repeat protein
MRKEAANLIYLSHASADDALVADLRQALEAFHIPVWVDSRKVRGGGKLVPEVEAAIEQARQTIVVLSPNTVNSPWVRREIALALEVEGRRKADGYRVVPVLLPGVTPDALGTWFDEERVAVPIEIDRGGVTAALPALLAAMGERMPMDFPSLGHYGPVEELVLGLSDPKIETHEGKRRLSAIATLIYELARPGVRRIESRRFPFVAPLGPIETADLQWYLETYVIWPDKMAQQRAEGIASKLPQWGQDLFQAGLGATPAREVLTAWQQVTHNGDAAERRFSVQVDRELPEGSASEAEAAAAKAATELLALPWELLHDGRAWLFLGTHGVRVRRRLPNRHPLPARPTTLPIRILLVSPRPEIDDTGHRLGFIDHRVSARPLTEALENLGDLARLTVLQPPTLAALEEALQAGDAGHPFDIIHFDGHGVYDLQLGLGGLCFEYSGDEDKLEQRRADLVDAARFGGLVREHRIGLVFLDACQTAVAQVNPTASVAGRLVEAGVTSVVALSHNVLIETARRFVQAFYSELATGARVGRAMLAGQQALYADPRRGSVLGAGELSLQDWFVPVLYQEDMDLQLITLTLPLELRQLEAQKRRSSLAALPEPPPHHFQGRSRELLALERLLHREPWAVIRGTSGQGKTTLAVELARWLTRTGRFVRAAFVSLEHHRDALAVLDTLSQQLLPEGDQHSVAQFRGFDDALQPIERTLANQATILVFDNCESVLPERGRPASAPPDEDIAAIWTLCRRLLQADPRTRLVFATREPLPAPFDVSRRELELGALGREDAIELVSEVMKLKGWMPPGDDAGSTPQEIIDLVEAVNRHARALVLLGPEVARSGVKGTTRDLKSLIAGLERKHPSDRENSLYASVELSLRRLSAEWRDHVRVLAACQSGVHLAILAMLTGLSPELARKLASELIDVGLGEDRGYGHLRLDPGLSPYLLGELALDEVDTLRFRLAEAMSQLTEFLYQEQGKDARLASHLTLLELPNLLAMLDGLHDRWPPERMVDLAEKVERLVANLGRPQALARAAEIREQAAKKLGDWSHARFLSEDSRIDRLLERGDFLAAHAAALELLEKCRAGGETAYFEAPYDSAMAHFNVGRVLKQGGAAEDALGSLVEARRRFQKLVDTGETSAERMGAVAIMEIGDCLCDLGRLDEAAEAYEESIRSAESINDLRAGAVAKFQLGTVLLLQNRYEEALRIYAEGRISFEALGEPLQVATVWHQIGMVHEKAGHFERAEQAYRQSLSIKVREGSLAGEASSLGQLGNLYNGMGLSEEAATFFRQAVEAYERIGDPAREGKARSNLADTLIKLRRYDEARQELQRAIECGRPYGHAAQPWKAWAILEAVERDTGQVKAAHTARQQAIGTYLAYRRAGGVSQSPGAQLFLLVAKAIQENAEAEARQSLDQLGTQSEAPPPFRALIARLQSILSGDRNPALASDPELDYGSAGELQLLLESLAPA